MLTIAYIGFGVSVREYHIPYVEGREDIRVKYVFRRAEDAPQFAEYEPFYPELTFTSDLDRVLNDPEVSLVVVNTPDQFHTDFKRRQARSGGKALRPHGGPGPGGLRPGPGKGAGVHAQPEPPV